MDLVGIGEHGLLGTRRGNTEGAERRVGEELGYNHHRRLRSDVVSAAIVRVTCLAGIDYF